MFVHQKWVESRLKIPNDIFEEGDDYVTLPPEFYDNMWQPDPYFLNSKIAGNFFIQQKIKLNLMLNIKYPPCVIEIIKHELNFYYSFC